MKIKNPIMKKILKSLEEKEDIEYWTEKKWIYIKPLYPDEIICWAGDKEENGKHRLTRKFEIYRKSKGQIASIIYELFQLLPRDDLFETYTEKFEKENRNQIRMLISMCHAWRDRIPEIDEDNIPEYKRDVPLMKIRETSKMIYEKMNRTLKEDEYYHPRINGYPWLDS